MRKKINSRPKYKRSGEAAYFFPKRLVAKQDELALTLSLITHRYLFGLIYAGLLPQYFFNMPEPSGVFVTPIVPTALLSKTVSKPGDIDLLVIPYEGDELVLDKALALEIKAIRATFARQGKSPNKLGFSQANGLLEIGFPYVGLAHLIVSDDSPMKAWRPMGVLRVLDEEGRCEQLADKDVDWMPVDLMQRAIGRLQGESQNPNIGLVASYLGSKSEELYEYSKRGGTWYPETRAATLNLNVNQDLLLNIGGLFDTHADWFMDIPRYDPK